MDDHNLSATSGPAATDRLAVTERAGDRTAARVDDIRPLIAHVIFRLDFGGLENGLVNLINRLSAERFRHAIVCIDDYTEFASRLDAPDIPIIAIHKRPGTDLGAQWRLFKAFRQLRPALLHTRNLAALDALLPARLAGVALRIHGEHGWDVNDLGGHNNKLRMLRKLHAPLVTRYVALSRDLEDYLVQRIGIDTGRVSRICNGVDVQRFRPPGGADVRPVLFPGADREDLLIIGTVGRMQAVKDPLNLVDGFARMIERRPDLADRARLVLVGDGPLLDTVRARLGEHGIERLVRLVGPRNDVAGILRGMDIFVQPSLAEGISNTILEAMASGLPVVATHVGGNSELVDDGVTGTLVPPADASAIAAALTDYVDNAGKRAIHGADARRRAVRLFSIDVMVENYRRLYEEMLAVSEDT